MNRSLSRTVVLAAAMLLAACTAQPADTAGPSSTQPTAPPVSTAASPTPAQSGQPPAETIRIDWTVPTQPLSVPHDVAVPLHDPTWPDLTLPTLVEVRTGNHASEGYERITFAFRGAFPAYTIRSVDHVVQDGSGATVDLPGAAFLQVVFNPAHGQVPTALQRVGYRLLVAYRHAGDYEGYVSYGLGLADRAQVRVGELTRPDGSRVVFLDLRSG